jgi:hypothetical protein
MMDARGEVVRIYNIDNGESVRLGAGDLGDGRDVIGSCIVETLLAPWRRQRRICEGLCGSLP